MKRLEIDALQDADVFRVALIEDILPVAEARRALDTLLRDPRLLALLDEKSPWDGRPAQAIHFRIIAEPHFATPFDDDREDST